MKVKIVNLFEEEQKRERRNRYLRLTAMAVFGLVAVSFGQDFGTSLGNVRTRALGYVKIAANVVLFFMFVAKIIPALTGSQKDTNWWELIGILAAVIVVNTANDIWEALTPTITATPSPSS